MLWTVVTVASTRSTGCKGRIGRRRGYKLAYRDSPRASFSIDLRVLLLTGTLRADRSDWSPRSVAALRLPRSDWTRRRFAGFVRVRESDTQPSLHISQTRGFDNEEANEDSCNVSCRGRRGNLC